MYCTGPVLNIRETGRFWGKTPVWIAPWHQAEEGCLLHTASGLTWLWPAAAKTSLTLSKHLWEIKCLPGPQHPFPKVTIDWLDVITLDKNWTFALTDLLLMNVAQLCRGKLDLRVPPWTGWRIQEVLCQPNCFAFTLEEKKLVFSLEFFFF